MYVTNCVRGDGFGAQYQNIIWAILLAEKKGYEFYYTPFSSMEHNYENDVEFLIKKENFINIKDNFPTVDKLPTNTQVQQLCGGINGIDFGIIENNLSECLRSDSFKKIKNVFHQNKKPVFYDDTINVAVHIRKQNDHDNHILGVHSEDYFLHMIEHIKNIYDDEVFFHIFSQGDESNFSNFKKNNIILHLNESIESTFYSMVTAQILVMSKSSLSYTAAMLSDGIIYYLPFWHKPSSSWLTK